ncbi:MAG: lipid II flippase MurJ, partial [Acidobacteriota bacterium]
MSSSRARFVALGILCSRLAGLVRTKAVGFYFGISPQTDVLSVALRAPNALQNLLGEQVLSASFIPVYSRLLASGRPGDAARFAGAVVSLLVVAASTLALLGVIFAPALLQVFAHGFVDDAAQIAAGAAGAPSTDRFPLAVTATRLVFPMTAVLVLSAWALGVLNSHRRFFLPYVAPVVWNGAFITALALAAGWGGHLLAPEAAAVDARNRWLIAVCAGALVGGALQFAIQLPAVLRLLGGLHLTPRVWRALRVPGVAQALRAFGPAVLGRGVVQLSLYLDLFLASLLRTGALGAVGMAGQLAALPISVFAMSVSASELPELSRLSAAAPRGDDDDAGDDRADAGAPTDDLSTSAALRARVDRALRQAAFVVAPTVVGYLLFGPLLVALLLGGGNFGEADAILVALVLAGYSVGLLASTTARLLQNVFFALGDTRTPARAAAWRVAVGGAIGAAAMVVLDRVSVADLRALVGLDGLEIGSQLFLGALGL